MTTTGERRSRKTIGGTDNPSVVGAARARNNGRYNGNGREWRTPPELFGPLNDEFGFTLDPCATPGSAKCDRFFTEAEDGRVQDWGQERVFMNPPYGKEIYDWTRKARESAEAGALVVGLLPASTDLRWWHEDVVGHAEVRYIRGRVRFLTDGKYRASGFFPSVVVVWRPKPSGAEAQRLERERLAQDVACPSCKQRLLDPHCVFCGYMPREGDAPRPTPEAHAVTSMNTASVSDEERAAFRKQHPGGLPESPTPTEPRCVHCGEPELTNAHGAGAGE